MNMNIFNAHPKLFLIPFYKTISLKILNLFTISFAKPSDGQHVSSYKSSFRHHLTKLKNAFMICRLPLQIVFPVNAGFSCCGHMWPQSNIREFCQTLIPMCGSQQMLLI